MKYKYCVKLHNNIINAKFCRVCGVDCFIRDEKKKFWDKTREFLYPKLKKLKLKERLTSNGAIVFYYFVLFPVLAASTAIYFIPSHDGETAEYRQLIIETRRLSLSDQDEYIEKVLPLIKSSPTDKDINDMVYHCGLYERSKVLGLLKTKKMSN
jgi:hypothetical protein